MYLRVVNFFCFFVFFINIVRGGWSLRCRIIQSQLASLYINHNISGRWWWCCQIFSTFFFWKNVVNKNAFFVSKCRKVVLLVFCPLFFNACFFFSFFFLESLTAWLKLAPRLIRVLIPFVIVIRRGCYRGLHPIGESHDATATTARATVHTRQSVRIAQWLLGEGLVSPAALEATLRFPLVLVTPVKLSLTC